MRFPPPVQEWLPRGHLVRFVVVDNPHPGCLTSATRNGGKLPHHPALLICGCVTGVFSIRKPVQAPRDSVAFRFTAGNRNPSHGTSSAFCKCFIGEQQDLFGQTLQITRSTGLMKPGGVSLDGTKIRANASKRKGRKYRFEWQLAAEVQRPMAPAEAFDDDIIANDIPEKIRRCNDRLAPIRTTRAVTEARAVVRCEAEKMTGRKAGGNPPQEAQPGPGAKDLVNITDPGSRIMKTADGFEQACNARAVNGSPVAAYVSHAANDRLQSALEQLIAAADAVGRPLPADSSCCPAVSFTLCEEHDLVPSMTEGRECLAKPPPLPAQPVVVVRARHRMAAREGKGASRQMTVESVFAMVKKVTGFRRFHLRDLWAGGRVLTLVRLAGNLRRIHVPAGT